MKSILLHLPAYREPELVPTIENALKNAKHPERIHFGICRQYCEEDGFDNIDKYRPDPRFKIKDIPYKEAKGLATARSIINDELLDDEDFVCQLDSHHRFSKNWDSTLIRWYESLKKDGYNPLIGGYLPYYNPFNDPGDRVKEPWLSEAACFYPHGTLFIRPVGVPNWKSLKKPYPARFLSGHFAFGPNAWAKSVRHDPNIFFAGEELNLTVRSFTHGYDLFHPHRVVIWHATMRTERDGMLVWDDYGKEGKGIDDLQSHARARVRQLLGVEDNGIDLGVYGLGDERSVYDFEKFAGLDFRNRKIQNHTLNHQFPPNPPVSKNNPWVKSFYHCINFNKNHFKEADYDCMIVAFDDADGNSVFRDDWNEERIKSNFSHPGEGFSFENIFNINHDKDPVKWVMWGHSKSKGWAERLEGQLT